MGKELKFPDREAERYPSWAWFGPALLSGIFLIVLGIVLYGLEVRNAAESTRALEVDAAAAREAIRTRLDSDRSFILSLSDDLSRGVLDEVAFQERVLRYTLDHPELLSVRWLSPDLAIHRQAPVAPSRKVVGTVVSSPESARAIRLAIEGGRSLWTRPFAGQERHPVIELWVPVQRGSETIGLFGATFSGAGIIHRAMPVPLVLDYRLTLEDGLGGIVAALPSVERSVDPKLSKLVVLDPPGYGVALLMERYGSRLWGKAMIALAITCVALAVGMGFGMWLLARSIAVRRRAENALRESNEALVSLIERERTREEELRESTKMEAVGRLAGGVAHDFNNLLTAILGYSDLLMERLPEGDRMRREIGLIRKAGERAAVLTKQLLAFGRKQVMRPRLIDLRAMVIEMEPMLMRLVGEGIDLAVRVADGAMTVHADPGQIEQAIVNLAANARDAMPGGGRLEITVSGAEVGPTVTGTLSPIPEGRYVLLTVKDSGIGIDESARPHLFEPFFTTKERGKGTGMGLPTVQGIVAQSGGHIEVDSAPGAGTEFRIWLPQIRQAVREAAKADAPSGAIAASSAKGRTVLVAEDEAVVRMLVVTILSREGYTVLEAGDGVDALRVAGAHEGSIDLLLTDVSMPRMGGKELAARLAALRPGTKVLFMSGYPDDELGVKGMLPEHVAFFAKPFMPATVVAKVRELIEG